MLAAGFPLFLISIVTCMNLRLFEVSARRFLPGMQTSHFVVLRWEAISEWLEEEEVQYLPCYFNVTQTMPVESRS